LTTTVKKKAATSYLLLANIGQLLTLRGDAGSRRGAALNDVGLMEDAAVLCGGGKIIAAGRQRDILRHAWVKQNRGGKGKTRRLIEIDCQGKVVLPGLVDCHTHPAFMKPRLVDFDKRIAGASYEEIAAAGGGIRSSLAAVRDAKRNALAEQVLNGFNAMLRHGTSTVEAKSGYGLSTESEIKSLEAIRDAARHWSGTVKPTLLAAHVIPPEFKGNPEGYVDLVCEEIIPLVARRRLAEYVDVFCERGAFTLEQSERIMATARSHGLDTRAHVCQFTPSSLHGLLKHSPASFDHMYCVADHDLESVAASDTVSVLLPGANYFLGHKEYPNARRLIEAGLPVALATDYNPGTSPTPSMPFVISLACTHMKLTPEEAVAASTINAAAALRLQTNKGSIEPGKDADLAVFDVDDYREIAYWFSWNRCVEMVVAGEVQDLTLDLRG
jgi:imidazolonepropionase